MATRGSCSRFRCLRRPTAVLTRIRSPRRSTHTGDDWGDPSGLIVATCQKFGSWSAFRIDSGSSAIPLSFQSGVEYTPCSSVAGSGSGAVDRLADDLVDGQRVGPVHALARDAPAVADALRDRRVDHLA